MMEKPRKFCCIDHDIWEPLYNIICTVAGTGILQLSFTLKQSGWVQLIVLILVAIMANYTGKIIIKCLYIDEDEGFLSDGTEPERKDGAALLIQNRAQRLDSYMAIGHRAFGGFGRFFVHVFQKLELFGVCCLFLILCGKFLTEGLSSDEQNYIHLDVKEWILVSGGLVAFPVLIFHDLSEVAILSLFGVLATSLVFLTIISYSVYNLTSDTNTEGGQEFAIWENLPITFAGTMLSFGGQPVYPGIEESMADSRKWPKALNIAFGFLLFLYVPVAVLGYATYGENTYSPILCNLPHSGPITIIMKLLITFHVLCAYPILMNVLCGEAEKLFFPHTTQIETFSKKWWASDIIRITLVAATVFIAYYVPYFADFVSFIGGVAVSFNTYVLPICFYLKLKRTSIFEKCFCCIILCSAIAGGTLGGFQALANLINKFKDGADPLAG